MRLLITGFILLTVCLLVLVFAVREAPAPPPSGPVRTSGAMVWKASRGKAVVWLCGTLHVLKASDYPLPAPYIEALNQSQHVVMELAPGPDKQKLLTEAVSKWGTLPAGVRLRDSVQPGTWSILEEWARKSGQGLGHFEHVPAWKAALMMSSLNQSSLGYDPSLGMERWFAGRLGTRTAAGLETAMQQLELLATLPPAAQESMIRSAADLESAGAGRMEKLIAAWAGGEMETVEAVMSAEFRDQPDIRQALLTNRNAAWLPEIEKLLEGTHTAMVLAGTAHFCGSGGIIASLRGKGVTIEQQTWQTTRPLPEK